MTARLRKTVGRRPTGGRAKPALLGLALVALLAACTSYTEIPIETPIQPKLDVSAFQRIFIAGFIAGANEDVDANMETVRLLRSQLRNKGLLRVGRTPPRATASPLRISRPCSRRRIRTSRR
jgi:hypothetical protein